jgi:hypothetical protein
MVFNENSYLARLWANKVLDENNNTTIEDVPELFNLKEVVESLTNKE